MSKKTLPKPKSKAESSSNLQKSQKKIPEKSLEKERVFLYDSTLRDGAQTSTVNFSVSDKILIAKMLDRLGIDFIEGGWPGANPTDDEFFANLPKLKKSQFVAFGMTSKNGISAENDPSLNALINSNVNSICIVGKSWDFHLTNALKISAEENLRMIFSSIKHIKNSGKEAIFDAEHFFDGYKANQQFAIEVIRCAYKAGARWIILCDTNGGSLPSEVKKIILEITKIIPGKNLGIHCHNDTGNAVANSLVAVEAGVRQVQGTINGLGERCGNANLTSLIPTLALKMGFDVGIDEAHLPNLLTASRLLDLTLNRESDKFAPYVGEFAFAHKGGLHASAVVKNAKCYEHIEPEKVGNKRKILVSDQAGRSNIINQLLQIGLITDEKTNDPKINQLVYKVKELESQGYSYDQAEASFEIIAKKALSSVPNFFEIISFQVIDERKFDNRSNSINASLATIKVKIDGKIKISAAEGNGPVNAMDMALRNSLLRKFPALRKMQLCDYRVRILNPGLGTKAITRVQIESQDDKGHKWNTIGVSENIVDASFAALFDSITYHLMKEENSTFKS